MVYMRALERAIRSPATLIAGTTILAIAAAIGVMRGHAAYGLIGAIVGGAAGVLASACIFYALLLPWRARQFVPVVARETDPRALDEIARHGNDVERMVAAYKERELKESGQRQGPA